MAKPRVATIWLEGCSGCHMSFLDMDERLLELGEKVDLVWGPLADLKVYPENVDVCLVEGAIASEEDLHRIQLVRERTKIVIAFGDCAVTSNVPSMRNQFGSEAVLKRGYLDNSPRNAALPCRVVPRLLEHVRPVHEFVRVDYYLPGCPPSADTIYNTLMALLEGREPDIASLTRFGA
jgi:NAD-reducing hydrogenase small subunit